MSNSEQEIFDVYYPDEFDGLDEEIYDYYEAEIPEDEIGKPCPACFGTGLDRELDSDCLTCWGDGVL
jgi:hypothetical protein